MSSSIGTRQAGIVTAVSALSAFSGKDVKTARTIEDAFKVSLRQDGAVVVYAGWESGQLSGGMTGGPLLGNKTMTPGRESWAVIVLGTSLRSATDAETRTGGLYELVEALRDVRLTSIGNDKRGTSVYLLLQSERLERDPFPSAAGGGASGYVCLYTTTQMFA